MNSLAESILPLGLNDSANARAITAVLLREFHAALVNRYLQVFSVLALAGGVSATVLTESPEAAGFFLLQIVLYFVPLFALLVGISSARAESEEWPLLFTQPVPRGVFVIGKFIMLWVIFAGASLLLHLPGMLMASGFQRIGALYFQTLGLAAAFGSLGLCAGFLARDRVSGLMLGVGAWLVLLFGLDLLALFAGRWPSIQKIPDLWVAALMINPLDAFRIQALFAMEQIPAEAADKTPLAHWWITHASLWFAMLCVVWTGALLLFTSRRIRHWEE